MTLPSKGIGLHLKHQAQRQNGGHRFEFHLHGEFNLRVRYRVVPLDRAPALRRPRHTRQALSVTVSR